MSNPMTDDRALELLRWLTNGSDGSPPPPDVTLQQAYDHIAARLQAQQPVAYCDPSDPINSTAFAWPGTDRAERHREPLFTHPQPPSIPEPSAEHWRMAIKERGIENPKALDWIEQRARQMAKAGGDRG